jgi:hypothetical protein
MHSRLDDLKKFKELEKKSGNPYLAIQKLTHKSRKLGTKYKGVNDSHLITCALHNEEPSIIHKNKISIESSYQDDLLSRVSDEDVVRSVKLSLKYSTRDNIQYVYTDSLEKCDESRVQVLVNMILDHQDLV